MSVLVALDFGLLLELHLSSFVLSMPALLLSEANATTLRTLVEKHGDAAELTELKAQLDKSLQPAQEGAVYPEGTIIHHRCLVQISKWAANRNEDFKENLCLGELLKGAQVAIGVKPKPARSPELIETLRKIKLMQEQEEYDRMMVPSMSNGKSTRMTPIFQASKERESPWQPRSNRTEAEEWEDVKKQISAIANVALSVGAVATATWWAGGNADPIWKTLVAMPLCLLVAIAEIALYARHWDNVQKRKAARQ